MIKSHIVLGFVLIYFPWCPGAQADSTALSIYDARLLVEHTPAFLRAKEKGLCPTSTDTGIDPYDNHLAVSIVRGECKNPEVIQDFEVNLDTGVVRNQAGDTSPIETKELVSVRNKLFEHRLKARLSQEDASCLFDTIVVPTQGTKCWDISPVGPRGDTFARTSRKTCPDTAKRLNGDLFLDRYSGEITDSTDRPLTNATYEALRARFMTLHAPLELTEDEAKRMLMADPSSIPGFGGLSCPTVEAGPNHNAQEIWFQVTSCRGDSYAVVVVDVATGTLTALPDQVLDSAAWRDARTEAFSRARRKRLDAESYVHKACPGWRGGTADR